MAYLTFSFVNTNDDQTFTVNDLINTAQNPIFNGAVNHGDASPEIQCWAGSNNTGLILIQGSRSPALNKEIDKDGEQFDY